MDAIIKDAVREELRRQARNRTANEDQHGPQSCAPSTSTNNSRTTARLSGLLDRVRNGSRASGGIKKRKVDKERRIQIRWIHYNANSKRFEQVRQKNGGGSRFIAYSDSEPPRISDIKEKATALFFPSGISSFAGSVDDMLLFICDTTQDVILEFPGDGTLASYLRQNGLYASTTYLYLRSQNKQSILDEWKFESRNADAELENDEEMWSMPSTSGLSVAPTRIICSECSCTYIEGEECLRCEQGKEFNESIFADTRDTVTQVETGIESESDIQNCSDAEAYLTMDEVRERRIAALSHPTSSTQDTPETGSERSNTIGNGAERNVSTEDGGETVTKFLKIHRSHIKHDLIQHFKDDNILNCDITFEVINERGEAEQGVGIGVTREVYTLFWKDFSISMTIGERERVPFVRHDHFVEEWEAVGRILVKGYVSAAYFPFFLSKAFICYCLFGNQVKDKIFLDSFMKYLSHSEEELISNVLNDNAIPEDREELDDFLERFNCRTAIKKENIAQVILEISKQELIQKPHLMVAAWQPIFQKMLKVYPEFESIAAVEAFYESIQPSTKKVLDSIECNPRTDGERDALKFLQRFVRGLDLAKLKQFLEFTTAMDIMGTKKLQVTFTRSEGFSSRPIAHTCGPVLELPSTYANFVELREEFTNILNRGSWEMDIM